MKTSVRIRSFLVILPLLSAVALCGACGKKEGPVRAMTTFVIGSVTLERPGSAVRPLGHKVELKPGDVVRTGAASMLVIQIGRDSVISIEADTTMGLYEIMGRNGTRLLMEEGRVLSRLRHLQKGRDFRIYTKAYMAAVRGTEFSVQYGRGEPVVAVSDGTVEVKKAAAGRETGEGEMIGAGNAAVVKEDIRTRPVSEDESKEFDRFHAIEPIDDIDGTSGSDIIRMEADYLKGGGAGSGEEKKADGVDASSKQGKPSDNEEAEKVVLWTGKSVYTASDTVVVYYKNMPEYRNCWIDISRAGDGDGRYRAYNWTYSAAGGKMEFPGLGLEPGLYEVRAHFSKSNSVEKRFRFRVQ